MSSMGTPQRLAKIWMLSFNGLRLSSSSLSRIVPSSSCMSSADAPSSRSSSSAASNMAVRSLFACLSFRSSMSDRDRLDVSRFSSTVIAEVSFASRSRGAS